MFAPPVAKSQSAKPKVSRPATPARAVTPQAYVSRRGPANVSVQRDSLEHEASRVADQVVSSHAAAGSRAHAALPVSLGGAMVLAGDGRGSSPEHVRGVLRAAGEPIGGGARAVLEPRFGYDFRNVRVHTDEHAARSAEALGAKAYTSGSQIAFAAGQYQPQTRDGQRLLAHELTHVLQQGGAESQRGSETRSGRHAALRIVPQADRSSTQPVQRKEAETWAGVFSTVTPEGKESYRVINDPRFNAYGAEIDLSFAPKDVVNASKIAFVQTAQSLVSGAAGTTIMIPHAVHPGKEQDIFDSRLVQSTDAGKSGLHVDASPGQRTPLYSMLDPPKGDQTLAHSVEHTKLVQSYFGHRTDTGTTMRNAEMHDTPGFTALENESGFMQFESAAVAVEGAQAGTYYGSVSWGLKKDYGEKQAGLFPFHIAREAVPSDLYFSAAKAWSATSDTTGEASIPLSLARDLWAKTGTELVDQPHGGKSLAHLGSGVRVEALDEASQKGWVRVVVTSGAESGVLGWVKASQLAGSPPAVKKH